MRFIELRNFPLDAPTSDFAELQRRIQYQNKYAADNFPLAIAKSQLTPWSFGEPLPRRGLWLLIGVADWNLHDLRVLDAVSDHLTTTSAKISVSAINVAGLPNEDPLRDVFSSAESGTPLVSFWRDGRCKKHAAEWAGRTLIEEILGPIHLGEIKA